MKKSLGVDMPSTLFSTALRVPENQISDTRSAPNSNLPGLKVFQPEEPKIRVSLLAPVLKHRRHRRRPYSAFIEIL